jgi:thymidylate synthase
VTSRDEASIQSRASLAPVHIVATDLDDAWFKVIYEIMSVGYRYPVERGSYEGAQRIELDLATVQITDPGSGPLLPIMPEGLGVPAPADITYVETEYFPGYLMSSIKAENEQYTYGERINQPVRDDLLGVERTQLEWAIEILRDTPATNQACVEIGQPSDIVLHGKDGSYDPPCMRLIDFRVRYGKLHLIAYFRSWDAWNGLPVNLAGLELLKRYVSAEIGVESGELVGVSKGLHIYQHAEEAARIRTHMEPKAEG